MVVAALTPASAVVIDVGDGQGNITAPTDDFGFGNIGKVGVASGIYLGNFNGQHWVMTANHVGANNIEINGVVYQLEAGSAVQLDDPGSGNKADVLLYRITSAPTGLQNLKIANSPMTIGNNLFIAGAGRNRNVSPSYWNIVEDVWESVPGPTADRRGFTTENLHVLRWGTNTVSGIQTIESGTTTQEGFRTTFNPGTTQGVYGDSGGGAFYKEGEDWYLAGLMISVGNETGQDGGNNTAVLSTNHTYYVDLSHYSTQIMAIIPEPRTITFIGAFLWMTFCVAVHRRYIAKSKE